LVDNIQKTLFCQFILDPASGFAQNDSVTFEVSVRAEPASGIE